MPDTDIFEAPTINSDFVCISDNYVLAAQIASCFNKGGEYFAVLELPRLRRPDWTNEILRLNNVLARVKSKYIIFAGVNADTIQKIKSVMHLREERYIYISNKSHIRRELLERLQCQFEGEIKCLPEPKEIAVALLYAKSNNLKLVVSSDAERFDKDLPSSNHLLFTDDLDSLSPVLLANYAFACGAELRFISSDKKVDPDDTWKAVSEMSIDGGRGNSAISVVNTFVDNISPQIEVAEATQIATFFTEGYPYGYLLPRIPSTHIFSRTLPSYFIASRIAYPHTVLESDLLINPVEFADEKTNSESEVESLVDLFDVKGVFSTVLAGRDAGMWNMDNHIQLFPYDLLYISSHAGFQGGDRYDIQFTDKSGIDHIITIDEVVAFGITDIGEGDNRIIDVRSFISFVAMDGNPWFEKTKKSGSSKTWVQDFLDIDRQNWNVIKKEPVDVVPRCSALSTSKKVEAYLPMPHNLSDNKSMPVIFNNACMSFHNFAGHFFFGGAGTYIGTMQSVLNPVAVSVSTTFFDKCLTEHKPTALALWESETETYQDNRREHIYLQVGCHFSKLLPPVTSSKVTSQEMVATRIENTLPRWYRVLERSAEKDVVRNTKRAIVFLTEKLAEIRGSEGRV